MVPSGSQRARSPAGMHTQSHATVEDKVDQDQGVLCGSPARMYSPNKL